MLPYTTEDLSAAEKLAAAGCKVLMPWASPIGSARGLINRDGLKSLRAYFPETTLIVDAGIGAPSQAAEAMELGYDAVLLNTAVAKAGDPVKMAQAFASADRGRAPRLRGGADRAARHGVTVDAGCRHALLQDRPRLLSDGALDPFYPVLPDAAWVARIASQGAKFIQLRVKDMPPHSGQGRDCASARICVGP